MNFLSITSNLTTHLDWERLEQSVFSKVSTTDYRKTRTTYFEGVNPDHLKNPSK